MRLLAIDTATEFCSVALQNGSAVLTRGKEAPREHAQLILPFVQEVLGEAQLALADFDGLVIGRGPGSFTGVRIAAGVGQGLAFSQQLPVVGVSNLQALAQQAHRLYGASQVVAAIDARMGEVYFGTYVLKNGLMQQVAEEKVGPPANMLLPENAGATTEQQSTCWHAVGTGFVTYPELLTSLGASGAVIKETDIRLPHAEDMLVLGAAAFTAGKGVAAEAFEVHYVRNEVTWQKLPGRT